MSRFIKSLLFVAVLVVGGVMVAENASAGGCHNGYGYGYYHGCHGQYNYYHHGGHYGHHYNHGHHHHHHHGLHWHWGW